MRGAGPGPRHKKKPAGVATHGGRTRASQPGSPLWTPPRAPEFHTSFWDKGIENAKHKQGIYWAQARRTHKIHAWAAQLRGSESARNGNPTMIASPISSRSQELKGPAQQKKTHGSTKQSVCQKCYSIRSSSKTSIARVSRLSMWGAV